MRLAPIALVFLSVLFPFFSAPVPAQAADCTFVLGFATLHDMIPNVVGICAVDEHHNPVNGDGLQETTMPNGNQGLLVWRKADNWTAFTDGFRTWINGPFGLRERLNTDCFFWEICTPAGPTAPAGTTVAFTSVTGASVGGTASASVHTAPGLTCAIEYWGPLGHDRVENGALVAKQTDGSGNVSWSWVIAAGTPSGTGTVRVNCGGVVATSNITIGTPSITVAFTQVNGAAPGGNPSVAVHTVARATCTIDYSGPLNRYHWNNQGNATQADWNGNVSWSWPIPADTPAGNGTVTVTCNRASATAPVPVS
jgi:hypothetical protein